MKIVDGPFTNTDAEFEHIKQLLLDIEAHPEIDNNWNPGRMDWWRYSIHAEKDAAFFRANAHYWKTDADQIVGLFISEYGKDDFFIVVHPQFLTLYTEILAWGLDIWAPGKAGISTAVFTYGHQKIQQLLAAGFAEDGHEEKCPNVYLAAV